MPQKSAKKHHTHPKQHKKPRLYWGWIIAGIFATAAIIPLFFIFYFHNKIYPGVYIAGSNFSGKTQIEAEGELAKNYTNLGSHPLTLKYQDRTWEYKGDDLGVTVNIAATASRAYNTGRTASLIDNLTTLLRLQTQPLDLEPEIEYNNESYQTIIKSIENEVNVPLITSSLFVDNNTIKLSPGSPGKEIERDLLDNLIKYTLVTKNTNPILIPVKNLLPPTTPEDEEKTLTRAQDMYKKVLNLTIGDNTYSLGKNELISLISFTGNFDQDKIASFAANLSLSYDKPPQDAAFKFEQGKVTVFKPAKDGQTINQLRTIPMIITQLQELEATSSTELTLDIPVTNSQPKIKTGDVNDLGIRELLGKGVSYFRGSIASRVHNVALAASRINGIVIKPEEEFSFNQAVGDISGSTGYQQAYIIQNGRTVLGDGGGVCQVSTTLFRAALNAGLPITSRTAHAYRVAYYEQGFGAGLDATVYSPSVDFKFKNDTPAHILIQAYPDTRNYTLVFELYGTSDGRQAYVSTPRIWDQTPPPPPKYEDDPTMPAGTEKQVDWAAWGAKTSFDYKVTRGNETLIDKTFYSTFRPWQAVYLRGTRT